jgi:ATP-dependent helicase/DNAse subunit B
VRHATLNPTSIETFQQCPFQFFARRTLKLNPRPAKPRDRLDVLLQGSILHQALAEGSFDRVFGEQCRKKNIPAGYRTEAVRLELVRNFEAFMADRQWPLAWPALTEQSFAFPLTPDLTIRGRIDRLETGPDQQAIVIDYKYSPAIRIRDRPGVQGGLYLLAAERDFGLQPAGMFYCALREPIAWEGWHAIPGLKLGEATTPSVLRELIAEGEQQARETFDSIAAGDKQVRPADRAKCRYCDYNQICRIEESGSRLLASGSSE